MHLSPLKKKLQANQAFKFKPDMTLNSALKSLELFLLSSIVSLSSSALPSATTTSLPDFKPRRARYESANYGISKYGFNRPNIKLDTAISKRQNLQRNV